MATPRRPAPRKRAPAARRDAVALRLLAAQEEERRRIARMLHDDLGQTLTAAVLELEYARSAPDAPAVIDAVLVELRRLLGDARDLSLALRPALIDEAGLDGALSALASRLQSVRGCRVDVDLRPGSDGPDAAAALAAFRIVQDAAFALAAPGVALRIEVSLQRGRLRVRVAADPATVPAPVAGGIAAADRAALFGGTARWRREGTGVVLLAQWPKGKRAG
jgi:two-component system sensor histidine kinase UhpB